MAAVWRYHANTMEPVRAQLGLLEDLAERRIREAQIQGEFDNLPGSGRPLQLDDDALIPEDLRAAYRVLKNAGYVPPEVEALRDVNTLVNGVLRSAAEDDVAGNARAQRRLLAISLALEKAGVVQHVRTACQYQHAMLDKLGQQGEQSS